MIPKRRLGRTGVKVSVITLGGCGPGKLDQAAADRYIEKALSHGVNMVDVAPTYGDAEERLAPWMKTHRGKLFLAEKTTKRTKKEAWKELNTSLEKLGVESFDLYQMHGLGTMKDVETAFGPGGAIEAFKEAQETGLTRYLGVTGHADMRVHLEALRRHDFDLVLLPVSLCSAVDLQPVNDYRPVLEYAMEHDMGVTAIKAVCRGRWRGEKGYSTWYEPSYKPRDVEKGVRFTLSQPGVSTAALACDCRLWDASLEAGERFKDMTREEQDEAVEWAKRSGFTPLFPE